MHNPTTTTNKNKIYIFLQVNYCNMFNVVPSASVNVIKLKCV